MIVPVLLAPTPSTGASVGSSTPAPSPETPSATPNTGPFIVLAAVIALVGVLITVGVQVFFGRRSAAAANKSAEAATEQAKAALAQAETAKKQAENAERSATAAATSARAATEAVGVNRDTAAGVALRAEADARSKRYQDATVSLGHPEAHVRLAGVYAMASLADDWPEQRQSCVDVLCAYMRLPERTRQDSSLQWVLDEGDLEVRTTILSLIESHVMAPVGQDGGLWSAVRMNLDRAVVRGLSFQGAVLSAGMTMRGARFIGACSMTALRAPRGIDISGSMVESGAKLEIFGLTIGDDSSFGVTVEPDAVMVIDRLIFENEHDEPQTVLLLSGFNCYGLLKVSPSPHSQPGRIIIQESTVGTGGRFSLGAGRSRTTSGVSEANIEINLWTLEALHGSVVSLPVTVKDQHDGVHNYHGSRVTYDNLH